MKKTAKVPIQKGKIISNPPAINIMTAAEGARDGKKQNKGIKSGRTMSLKKPKK